MERKLPTRQVPDEILVKKGKPKMVKKYSRTGGNSPMEGKFPTRQVSDEILVGKGKPKSSPKR